MASSERAFWRQVRIDSSAPWRAGFPRPLVHLGILSLKGWQRNFKETTNQPCFLCANLFPTVHPISLFSLMFSLFFLTLDLSSLTRLSLPTSLLHLVLKAELRYPKPSLPQTFMSSQRPVSLHPGYSLQVLALASKRAWSSQWYTWAGMMLVPTELRRGNGCPLRKSGSLLPDGAWRVQTCQGDFFLFFSPSCPA